MKLLQMHFASSHTVLIKLGLEAEWCLLFISFNDINHINECEILFSSTLIMHFWPKMDILKRKESIKGDQLQV
jgi:hypothetical protein